MSYLRDNSTYVGWQVRIFKGVAMVATSYKHGAIFVEIAVSTKVIIKIIRKHEGKVLRLLLGLTAARTDSVLFYSGKMKKNPG